MKQSVSSNSLSSEKHTRILECVNSRSILKDGIVIILIVDLSLPKKVKGTKFETSLR